MIPTELSLNPGDIHLWVSHPAAIDAPDLLAAYRNLLTDEEKKELAGFHLEKNRHRYLVARALLRTALSRYAETSPQEWRFFRNRYGKPGISPSPGAPPISFNISHTEGLTLCGIAKEKELGVDVEDITCETDATGIADRFFSPREAKDLAGAPEHLKNELFFDYWTLKESYVKACGMGFSIPLDDFSFQFNPLEKSRIYFHSRRKENPADWKFLTLDFKGKYRIAVALRCSGIHAHHMSMIETVPLSGSHELYCPIARSCGAVSHGNVSPFRSPGP